VPLGEGRPGRIAFDEWLRRSSTSRSGTLWVSRSCARIWLHDITNPAPRSQRTTWSR
jgi:hypothetical protein